MGGLAEGFMGMGKAQQGAPYPFVAAYQQQSAYPQQSAFSQQLAAQQRQHSDVANEYSQQRQHSDVANEYSQQLAQYMASQYAARERRMRVGNVIEIKKPAIYVAKSATPNLDALRAEIHAWLPKLRTVA